MFIEGEQFPGCCGIQVIHELWDWMYDTPLKPTQEAVKALSHQEKIAKQEEAGLILICLTTGQRRLWQDVLVKRKYKLLKGNFKNPGHKSRLHLYSKVIAK